MNETFQAQYIHFIKEATNPESLKHLEEKIIRNYGEVPGLVALEITKRQIVLQNKRIKANDKAFSQELEAQNEKINQYIKSGKALGLGSKVLPYR